jgi:ankyrin repeat protein
MLIIKIGTALHYACTSGHVDIVKLLIEHICQKNKQLLGAPDKKGKSPLQFAVQEGI